MTLPAAVRERRRRLTEAVQLVDDVLFRLARQGLVRASPATRTELEALAKTAHTAGMIAVERELAALATLVGHYLDRDPNFRPSRLVARMTRIHEKNVAARCALEEVVDPREGTAWLGEARRSYVPVDGVLHLQALAAVGWLTDSDFVGITVHLRSGETAYTVSAARPAAYFGNDPARLYRQYLSESVDLTVEGLAHGAVVFEHAKAAHDRRLSIHGGLVVRAAPWSGTVWRSLTVGRWADALVRIRDADDDRPSLPLLVTGLRWGRVTIDEQRSEAAVDLEDATGAVAGVRIPLRPENNLLIDNLQTLARRRDLQPAGLFGPVTATPAGIRFEPWTAVYDAPVSLASGRRTLQVDEVHLGLEDLERVQR